MNTFLSSAQSCRKVKSSRANFPPNPNGVRKVGGGEELEKRYGEERGKRFPSVIKEFDRLHIHTLAYPPAHTYKQGFLPPPPRTGGMRSGGKIPQIVCLGEKVPQNLMCWGNTPESLHFGRMGKFFAPFRNATKFDKNKLNNTYIWNFRIIHKLYVLHVKIFHIFLKNIVYFMMFLRKFGTVFTVPKFQKNSKNRNFLGGSTALFGPEGSLHFFVLGEIPQFQKQKERSTPLHIDRPPLLATHHAVRYCENELRHTLTYEMLTALAPARHTEAHTQRKTSIVLSCINSNQQTHDKKTKKKTKKKKPGH